MSGRCSREVSRDSSMNANAAAIAITPIGTLMKKIQFQLTCSRDQAADERADRERERRDAGPDADRRPALARRERDGDDRERRRVHHRGAEALDDARADQHVRAAGEPAGERGGREDDEAR